MLLFYFSGHGIPFGEDVYLTTPEVDAKIPSIKGLALSQLTNYMYLSKSQRIVSIIDSCYSASFGIMIIVIIDT